MATKTVAPGVCRFDLDDRNIRGYMVRIMRRRKMYQEFFSDKRCGGKRKAKKAAEERYGELNEELPDRINQKGQMTVRNNTGKVGVHVGHNIDKRWPNCEYWSYVASWLGEGQKRIHVSFAWLKYGEDLAWKLACIARDNELRDREQILAIHEQQKATGRAKRKPK